MPSTAAASSSSDDDMPDTTETSDKGSGSELENSDGDCVEEEEEEVEEEEEEEVEEEEEEELEEEEEEEDVDEEKSADLSDSPTAVNDDRNDSSQEIESEGHNEVMRSEKSQVSLASDAHGIEDSGGHCNSLNLTQGKKLSHVNDGDSKPQILGKLLVSSENNGFPEAGPEKKVPIEASENVQKDYDEAHGGNQAHLSNSNSMDADNTKSSCFNEKEVAAETHMRDGSGEVLCTSVLYSEEESKQMDMQPGEDIKERAPSAITPQLRPRSLSPGAEFEDRNKRPAILCDFFARGWCIKGSSCRFLHQKDGAEGDVAVASSIGELKEDAGLRQEAEKSRVSSFPEPLAASVANDPSSKSHFPLERVILGERGESQKGHQFSEDHRLSSFHREDLSSGIAQRESGSTSVVHHDFQQLPLTRGDTIISSFKDVGREGLRQNLFLDKYNRHASPVIDAPKFVSPGGGWAANPSSSEFQSSGIPLLYDNLNPHSDLKDNKRSVGEEFMKGYPLARNNSVSEYRFFSSGSVTSLSTYGNSNNSFSYERGIVEPISLKRDSHSMIYGAHTSPGFSSSLNSNFNIPLPSTGISPSQGSSPLRSHKSLDNDRGYYVSRSSSLPRSSSSPFYSRPEQENLHLHNVPGDAPVSTGHKIQSTTNDWEPSVPFRPSFIFPSTIISSPRSQYDPLLDSIEAPNGGDISFQSSSFSQGAPIQNTSHPQTNGDFVSLHQQPQHGVSDKNMYTHGIGTHMSAAEATGTHVADQENKSSIPKEENPLKPGHVGNASEANEVDLDHNNRNQTDGGRHNKESKMLKLFRAALVDFVKELVKPSWREGHLSKDVHKTIVKKAVDKVLSTLQVHQIPSTTESINQYLSSSRPKLEKLVEGYVGKYAKS